MSTAKLFLFAMAMAAVFFVGVNARVAAHYNNHEAYKELMKTDRLHELFSRGNCHCRGENWREHGSGTGTRFWIVGCDGNWQDCRDPGIMTSCCREEGKK